MSWIGGGTLEDRRAEIRDHKRILDTQRAQKMRTVTMVKNVVLVVQRLGVGLVIERSLVRLPAGALSSQLGQLSLPSIWGR